MSKKIEGLTVDIRRYFGTETDRDYEDAAMIIKRQLIAEMGVARVNCDFVYADEAKE